MQNSNDLAAYNGFCMCGLLVNKVRDNMTPETIQIINQCNHHTHNCICYTNQLPFNICRSSVHICACDTHSSFVTCFAEEDNHECICWNLTSKSNCIAKEHECGCCSKYWMKKYSKTHGYLKCQAKNHECEYKKIGYHMAHDCIAETHPKLDALKEILISKNINVPNEIFGEIMKFL
jgi:hypothetical protein